jgi:hypothetical protein
MFSKWLKSNKAPVVDPIAEARLDEALNDVGQQFVAQSVKRLPMDDVNLAWRSQLNEKLLVEQTRIRKVRKQNLIWRPVAGLAMASALAFTLMIPRSTLTTIEPNGAIEANVMHAHMIAERNYELTGSAVVTRETNLDAVPQTASYEWEEADLGAL